MLDSDCVQRDDGSVLNTAAAAVMLIAVGLGLLFWDNYRDAREPVPPTMLSARNAS